MEIDVDKILAEIKRAVSIAQNEREVQARVSSIIENEIAKKLGNVPVGRYEYTFISGSRKRADYLYGHVIIEYKDDGFEIFYVTLPKRIVAHFSSLSSEDLENEPHLHPEQLPALFPALLVF